jgi:hypothetical protein
MPDLPAELRQHLYARTDIDDNFAGPDHIAGMYLHLHRQCRSTWAFYKVVLRPWTENWQGQNI